MSNLLKNLLDLVFPPRCEVCKTSNQSVICNDCLNQIRFMKPYLGIYSVAAYEGTIRTAIQRFKFNNRKVLAEPLGLLMVKYLSQLGTLNLKEIDGLVPVPLHLKRERERGFNQAHLLANIIGRYHNLPVYPALVRSKNTKAQFGLPRAERFPNIAGAFQATNHNLLADRRLLLVDDIYTTGATISECSRVLKSVGAKRVEVLTLARAIED